MLAVVNDGHDIGGNDADAEGGNSDAETVPGSRVTMPESLQTPLPRHVTADSCTAAKSGKSPDTNTQQLLRGRGFC